MADVFKVSTDSIILGRTESTLDVSGLNPDQIHILENLISYFRKVEIFEDLYINNPFERERLIRKCPEIFKDENKK